MKAWKFIGAACLLVVVLLAARGLTEPGEASWSGHGDPQSLFTRFPGENSADLSAEEAFRARDHCPRLTSATLVPVDERVNRVEVLGKHLPRVTRVAAVLRDGDLADVMFKRRDATQMTLPLFCSDCDVFFGFDWEGRAVACRGPGYHLSLEGGRLIE